MAITDTLTEVGINGSITSLSAPGKAVGATSINVGSTSNWPAAGKTVFFAIRTVNPSAVTTTNTSGLVANTYSEWKGIVGTNAITSLTLQLGSVDQVYTAGANTQVLIPVTASRENALVAWGQKSHDNLGNLLPNIVTAANIVNNTITNAQIAPGGINFANLLTTIFGGQVTSYTSTGQGGGTGYYINLGGIKLVWGTQGSAVIGSIPANSTTAAQTVSYPAGFFTTVQFSNVMLSYTGTAAQQYISGSAISTNGTLYFITNTTAAVVQAGISWLAIGT